MRKVPFAEGDQKVAEGLWREVYDELGNHVGYQMGFAATVSVVMPSRPSSTGIPRSEMELNAGSIFAGGRSRTCGMPESKRLTRIHRETGKALPPEDRVERVQAKVRVWPDVEAQEKDILRVWPKK